MKQSQIDNFVDGGRLTGDWQEPRKDGPHGGIDIGPPQSGQTGVEVRAGIDGTVTFVGGNYGSVTIKTSDEYTIQYLHLNEIFVKRDDKVDSNTVLGEMGGRGPEGPNQYNIGLTQNDRKTARYGV
ncbi:MAG: M23 family metallopeptidase [Candidatus Methanomethylicaceae archaeon]